MTAAEAEAAGRHIRGQRAAKQLAAMFAGAFFDVCPITRLCEEAQVPGFRKSEAYLVLSALHCVHFTDMTGEVRQEIRDRLVELFGVESAGPLLLNA